MTVLVKTNQIIALLMAHKQVVHANVLISVFSIQSNSPGPAGANPQPVATIIERSVYYS